MMYFIIICNCANIAIYRVRGAGRGLILAACSFLPILLSAQNLPSESFIASAGRGRTFAIQRPIFPCPDMLTDFASRIIYRVRFMPCLHLMQQTYAHPLMGITRIATHLIIWFNSTLA